MTNIPASTDLRPGKREVELARRVAGLPASRGRRMAIVHAKGGPRWIVERRFGARGPLSAGVWRPALRRNVVAALAYEIGAAAGRLGEPIVVDPEHGLARWLAEELDVPGLKLGGVHVSPHVVTRSIVTLFSKGRLTYFAKVVAEPEPMELERSVLEAITRAEPETFTVPRPVALLTWNGWSVLVLEPLSLRGVAVRRFGDREVSMLTELAGLRESLADALGENDGRVPVHGDFVPWNTGHTRSGYAVWDWETARLGRPLHDFFHWHVQLAVSVGGEQIDELVQTAAKPTGLLETLRVNLGLDRDEPIQALSTYLRVRHGRAPDRPEVKAVLARGLALLGEDETADASG
jgi:Phosphotransferase enzyme family